MEFSNSTDFPAQFLPGSTSDREMLGIIVCKVTYLMDQGWLIPAPPDQAWPVFDKPFTFQDVILGPELDFRKNGVDIFVFGNAVSPLEKQTRHMRLAVETGRLSWQVDVFGDREWIRSRKKLISSEPALFEEMPLTNDRAYGGTAIWDEMELVHSVNPEGRGFYMSEAEAEGKPLPNLERPDTLIQTWEAQPLPACFFKPKGVAADPDAAAEDLEKMVCDMLEPLFNQTVPELVANPDDLGDQLRLLGFSPEGELIFPMPRRVGPTAHVSVGNLRSRFPSALSHLIVLAREQVLIATYLCLFRYLFRPMEKRYAELRWTDPPEVKPVHPQRSYHG